MLRPVLFKFPSYPESSGLGYHLYCLENAFDDTTVVQSLFGVIDDEDVMLIVLRYFFMPDPQVIPTQEINGLLERFKGFLIQSFVWDFHLTKDILPYIGRADLFHVHSNFLAKILQPYPTKCIPLPVKDIYKHRGARTRRTYTIGGVISLHPRKNHEGWVKLIEKVKKHGYEVVLVVDSLPHQYSEIKMLEEAGATLLHKISDAEMLKFYHSLDWFVSLSVGEGYGLPVREALACGVPVIAGAHTGFLDLPDAPCVRLVKVRQVPGAKYFAPSTIAYEPSIEDVLKIILNSEPPEVPQNLPIPRMEGWRREWANVRKQIEEEKRKPQVRIKEIPTYFALFHDQMGGGLNVVARLWAKRTASKTFLYPDIPKGSVAPVIVPYHEALPTAYATHNFFLWLATLKYKVNAPLIIWLHHALPPNSSSTKVLYQLADYFAATHPAAATSLGYLYLPLPIGEQCKGDETKGFFLAWGYNPATWKAAWHVAQILNLNLKIVATPHANWSQDTVNFIFQEINTPVEIYPHLTDEELEEYLDAADGYIICDPIGQPFEVSARLPTVLRKGKPIIANHSNRTGIYSSMLPLFPLPDFSSPSIHDFCMKVAKFGIQNLRPHNVPSIDEELRIFYAMLEKIKWERRT